MKIATIIVALICTAPFAYGRGGGPGGSGMGGGFGGGPKGGAGAGRQELVPA